MGSVTQYSIELIEAAQSGNSRARRVLLLNGYPAQLFFGPANQTAEILNYLDGYGRGYRKQKTERGGSEVKGFRMSSTYGALRNAGQRRKAQMSDEL